MDYTTLEKIRVQNNKKICIFGAGKIGKTWGYDILKSAGFEITCYCDNKVPANREIRDGIRTIDFDSLCKDKDDYFVFTTINEKIHDEIKAQFEAAGISNYVLVGFMFLQSFCESVFSSQDEMILERYKTIVDDKEYLKRQFQLNVGYSLNLDNPKTFNEKLQWLKLYAHKSEYTNLVDKLEFKKFIETTLGKKYVIPLLGVWDTVEEIEWDKLPEKFVLKCTHDSGSVAICKDKSVFDIEKVSSFFKKRLQRNYYWASREFPYKNVKPRIIAEEYMQSGDSETLDVYKVFNFYGTPRLIQVIQNDKTAKETIDYFDTNWKLMELRQNFPNSSKPLQKPKLLDKMLKLSRKLSDGFPFLRTDFYIIEEQLYVSEFTFYSDAGMAAFEPKEWDMILGEWITLPDKKDKA